MRSAGVGLLMVGLVAGWSAACAAPDQVERTTAAEASGGPLPMALHGMPLISVTAGAKAAAIIAGLHGGERGAVASYVGMYAAGGLAADLYVSRFAADTVAERARRLMSEAIGAGSSGFGHHAAFAVDGIPVHVVIGQGRTHFFFARGRDVLWLAVDPAMSRLSLADLLRAAPHRIPAGLRVDGIDVLPPPDSLYRRGIYDAEVASKVRRKR